MGIKAFGAKLFAKVIAARHRKWAQSPIATQQKVFKNLLNKGRSTVFGREHDFESIDSYEAFKKKVPIRDYEQFRSYINKIREGEEDVLWPGRPAYFSKTSGTTSGVKYIPITKSSIPYHMQAARDATLLYAHHTSNARFFDGKMIFLSGNPELEKVDGILTGRLSGIVHHHVPKWVLGNRLPSWETNCIDDWETKLDKIIDETLNADMRLISGIPPWVQMYFDRVMERTGKKIKEVWPDFSVLVHGGVNFAPYRAKLDHSIGGSVDYIETYPASEGFIAYQDVPESLQNAPEKKGLLLLLDHGMFYEFVPADEIFDASPTRLALSEVELGKNYALILNTNAGLWGYNIGDTVQFVSKNPYRLVVTGRTKHFISAFGEHVIAKEVEEALLSIADKEEVDIIEFTVAPKVEKKENEDSYHEWFIEFGASQPRNLDQFARQVDKRLQAQNPYYKDLVQGHILAPLKINVMQQGAFRQYMKAEGKLGGQNKVPRLSNDRSMADQLKKWVDK